MLIAAGTLDEAADTVSRKKEADMRHNIEKLNYELSRGRPIVSDTVQEDLDGF